MDARFQELIAILTEARALLALPDNDFSWSSWRDADDALAEVDGLIARLQAGQLPRQLELSILFVVTGPMQEASLSSGWSQEFLALASRFDAVEAKIWPQSSDRTASKGADMPIKVLYHGHSNLEIHAGPHCIQIDPFYTSNPLADVKADKANPTHILLSHAHFDHVEDALDIAKRTGALLAGNYEITTYYEAKGIAKTLGMNHGGGANLPFGRITYTIAFHSSSFADGTYGGQPGGWIIELPASIAGAKPTTIYFAGDTALFGDMKLIGELWNIDLACLPIGDTFTMGPAHAIKAAQLLRAKKVLPIHYNTWPPIAQDAAKFGADLKKGTGIHCAALTAGQSLET